MRTWYWWEWSKIARGHANMLWLFLEGGYSTATKRLICLYAEKALIAAHGRWRVGKWQGTQCSSSSLMGGYFMRMIPKKEKTRYMRMKVIEWLVGNDSQLVQIMEANKKLSNLLFKLTCQWQMVAVLKWTQLTSCASYQQAQVVYTREAHWRLTHEGTCHWELPGPDTGKITVSLYPH